MRAHLGAASPASHGQQPEAARLDFQRREAFNRLERIAADRVHRIRTRGQLEPHRSGAVGQSIHHDDVTDIGAVAKRPQVQIILAD